MILKKIRNLFRKPSFYLFIAIISFITSYFPLFIPAAERTNYIVVVGGGLLYLATICLAEYVTRKFGGFSQLRKILKNKNTFLTYLLVGFLGGVFLDGIAHWLSRLWVYPFWDSTFYLAVFVIGFSAYYLSVISSYLIVKTIIDKTRKGKKYITRPKKSLKSVFFILLILSVILISIGISGMLIGFTNGTYPLFGDNAPVETSVNVFFIIPLFFGIWFFIESLGYQMGKNTFIKELIHGYYDSFLAVFFSSMFYLIVMESQNGPIELWKYLNWPLQDVKLFYTPIVAIIAWPFHYLLIISLYKVISGDQTKNLLEGDQIE
jgi:hypothetical protein